MSKKICFYSMDAKIDDNNKNYFMDSNLIYTILSLV